MRYVDRSISVPDERYVGLCGDLKTASAASSSGLSDRFPCFFCLAKSLPEIRLGDEHAL
jgi:hypothetical protein